MKNMRFFLIFFFLLVFSSCFVMAGYSYNRGFVAFDIFNYTGDVENEGWYCSIGGADGLNGEYVSDPVNAVRCSYTGVNGAFSKLTNCTMGFSNRCINEFDIRTEPNAPFQIRGETAANNHIYRLTGNAYDGVGALGELWLGWFNDTERTLCSNTWTDGIDTNIRIENSFADNTTYVYINDVLECSEEWYKSHALATGNYTLNPNIASGGFVSINIDDYYFYSSTASINYSNTLPTLISSSGDYLNPTCLGSTVTHSIIEWSEPEFDNIAIQLDCYGNGTIIPTTSNWVNPTLFDFIAGTCTYNEVGTFNTHLYLYDDKHEFDRTSNATHTITISNSSFCYDAGQGTTGTGGNLTVDTTDIVANAGITLAELGISSTGAKIAFVLLGLILFNIAFVFGFIELGHNFTQGHAIILGMIDLCIVLGAIAFGLLPLWVLLILIMFAVIGGVGIFMLTGRD